MYEAFSPGFMMRPCWMWRNYVNECVPAHPDTETRRRGTHTPHTHAGLWRRSPNGSHEKEEKRARGRKRDLKSVARREINCTAPHKSGNKVSSLLSGVANVTVVQVVRM